MKKVVGIVIFGVGVTGLLLSIAGIFIGFRVVESTQESLLATLDLIQESLATVEESLELTKITVAQMNEALGTVEETADNVSATLRQTRPLLDQIGSVASGSVPDSIEAFQGTIPNLVKVAGVIDTALSTLSSFRIPLPLGANIGLGIEYEPDEPFDESVAAIGESLDGVPEQLRTLDTYLAVSNDNLSTISRNINDLADNVNEINVSIAEILPLIDDYIAIVAEIGTAAAELEAKVETQSRNVKTAMVIVFVWLALYQIMPLYVGWSLATGSDDRGEIRSGATEAA